ncbi:hypothetical protein I4U23_016233 [Adineta vaga]|nr:hypothetical protein I4U23_016233 [Adineta vaga]
MKREIFLQIVLIYLYFINGIFSLNLCPTAQWSMAGTTVAGVSGSQATRLSQPTDVFIDNASSIYVLDSGNYRVLNFPSGNATVGNIIIKSSSGNDTNKFSSMMAINIDKNGNIYILDTSLSRITKWNPSMNTTALVVNGSSFVNSDTRSEDSLYKPLGMFIEMDTMIIWIADTNNHRIVKWFNQTTVQIIVGNYGTQSNQFKYPENLFVDMKNNYTLYVVDTNNHRIQMFLNNQKNGTTVAGLTSYYGTQLNQLWYPVAVLVDQNQFMYILDNGNSRILQWKIGNPFGKLLTGTNTYGGSGSDQLSSPVSLTFDLIGRLYAVDKKNNRIQMYNITCLSTNDTITTTSSLPSRTTTTQSNSLSQCDIPIWSSNGITVAGSPLGDRDSDSFHLYYPYDILLDSNDTLYVLDSTNLRVQLFYPNQLSGITIINATKGTGSNQFSYMDAFAISSDGSIYILDETNSRLLKFPSGSSNGTIVAANYGSIIAGTDSCGNLPYQLNYPQRFRFDSKGNLYVADNNNHRVQKFSLICSPTMVGITSTIDTSNPISTTIISNQTSTSNSPSTTLIANSTRMTTLSTTVMPTVLQTSMATSMISSTTLITTSITPSRTTSMTTSMTPSTTLITTSITPSRTTSMTTSMTPSTTLITTSITPSRTTSMSTVLQTSMTASMTSSITPITSSRTTSITTSINSANPSSPVLFLIAILKQSIAQNIRSFQMSIMNKQQFQCVTTTCLPYATTPVSNIFQCQTQCLAQDQCKAVSFIQLNSTCQLFDDTPDQNILLIGDMDTVAMIVILGSGMVSSE